MPCLRLVPLPERGELGAPCRERVLNLRRIGSQVGASRILDLGVAALEAKQRGLFRRGPSICDETMSARNAASSAKQAVRRGDELKPIRARISAEISG
jgi:hypothetical protein